MDPELTHRITNQLLLDLRIEWLSGMCPVQAEGTVNGCQFYFRSRGCYWNIEIYPPGFGFASGHTHPGSWHYQEAYGTPGGFEAGYMPLDEARTFIQQAAIQWLNR